MFNFNLEKAFPRYHAGYNGKLFGWLLYFKGNSSWTYCDLDGKPMLLKREQKEKWELLVVLPASEVPSR